MPTSRHRFLSCFTVAGLVVAGVGTFAAPARASTSTTTFTFSGSSSQDRTLYDSGLIYADGCSHGALAVAENDPTACFPDDLPGTFWGHLHVGIHTTVVRAASADLTLQAADSFRQDSTTTLSTTFVAKDAAGKEVKVTTEPFIQFQAAYDAPLANCSKAHVTLATLAAGIDASDPAECINAYVDTGEISLGQFELLAQDGTLPYSGTKTLSQSVDSPSLDILPGILSLHLSFVTDLVLHALQGYTATRGLAASSAPGSPLSTTTLSWPDATQQSEDVLLPCGVPAGDNLLYRLSDVTWAGDGDVNVSVHPVLNLLGLIDITLPGPSVNIFSDDLTSSAAPWQQTLGPVQAENKAPTVAVATIVGGPEGTPIAFSAVGTGPAGAFDNCDATGAGLDYVWTFDDGSHAFGVAVSHAFSDNNGAFSRTGALTVTDPAGNATHKNFSVAVSNAAPVVAAGPDTTSAWGRIVSFSGAATDPGSADQPTLTYAWDFGDGSPSASGGASALHAYSTPGDYTATLTVGDKDGAASTATRTVHVRTRTTTLAWTGDHSGTFDTATSLAASLVDEFGVPVPGRSVALTVAGDAAGSASTNAAGTAAKSWTLVALVPGSGTATAGFAGDALYGPGSATQAYTVSVKGTTIAYTGALASTPNKSVSVSALLRDVAGKALSGKLVTLSLGTQSVTATTSTTGVATGTIKLNQKNGTKPVVVTYAGDPQRYTPASATATFKIG